ncbi:hypothetical protein J1614_004340 [Plenodomus biglobosus]|nr:hypothetical protein J1614_004340 [Plenodomus biglobosus]
MRRCLLYTNAKLNFNNEARTKTPVSPAIPNPQHSSAISDGSVNLQEQEAEANHIVYSRQISTTVWFISVLMSN